MKKLALAIFAAAVSAVGASAADMAPARRYANAPVAPVLVYSWTGFYIGATAGGDWGRSDANTSTVFSPVGYFAASSAPVLNAAGLQRINSSGFNGGIEAGYNWQANNFVLGV